MIPNPEMMNRVAQWRQKAQDGTLTLEEMKVAIVAMREGRLSAATASAESKAKGRAKAPARSAEDLLGELGI
jgi:hypothetical protein